MVAGKTDYVVAVVASGAFLSVVDTADSLWTASAVVLPHPRTHTPDWVNHRHSNPYRMTVDSVTLGNFDHNQAIQ